VRKSSRKDGSTQEAFDLDVGGVEAQVSDRIYRLVMNDPRVLWYIEEMEPQAVGNLPV